MKGDKKTMNMKIEDLKAIIAELPDDMDVIIPVIALNDANQMLAFRHVRTAGILSSVNEQKPALCLNASADGQDISSQIKYSNLDEGEIHVKCDSVAW